MNDLTVIEPRNVGVFSSAAAFESAQRMANALSKSSLVPKDYQNNLPNALIALEVAQRIGISPLLAMQNLYVVHGRPSWSSQFLIASFNQCGRFSAMQFEFTGAENSDDWSCRAFATERATGEIVKGPKVSIGMAKAEGWHGKNGSKWRTMPELILTYRAASWLVRTKAPEISMGFSSVEEARDMGPAERVVEAQETRTIDDELAATPAPVVAPETATEAQPEQVAEQAELIPREDASAQVMQALLSAIQGAESADDLDAIGQDIADTYAEQMTAEDKRQVKAAFKAAMGKAKANQ